MRRIDVFAVLFVICFTLGSINVSAQVKCANKLLTELVEQLPDVGLDNGFEGEIKVAAISNSKPLIVQRDNQGVITHVGIKFFDRDIINRHPTPIYQFIERYFLELLLLPTQEEINTKLHLEHVGITSEVFPLASTKEGLQDIVSAVSHSFSVYITCNNNRYFASCMNVDDNRLLAKISFPVRYELITGFTKLEAENSVYPELLLSGNLEYNSMTDEYMSSYKDTLFCANEEYYVTEDIISTVYYNKVKEDYVPVFSLDLLKESVCNLFNTGYDWGVKAEVEQNLYGNKKNTFTVSLAQLVNFFKSKNCNLYTGIRKYDKSQFEGVLMAVNMELGYQHIMMFSFSKDIFEEPSGKNVKIKMYSYVPIHNISSLF